jgi:UDP-N-acetylmuramate dehydrogenase
VTGTSLGTSFGMDSTVAAALDRLAGMAVADFPLAALTTYGVGGRAAILATPRSVDDLVRVGAVAFAHRLPVLVIGRGSNMLIADEGFAGIAITLVEMAAAIDIPAARDPQVLVRAGGAARLPVVARRTAAAGIIGFEWAVGVPGSIGGAVRMNAGGHGSDMAACLAEVSVVDVRTGEQRVVPATALGLRFRGSDLGDEHVVLDAVLRLAPGDAAAAEAELAEIVRWRREHQPGGQNAGSVFVNPIPGELSAGELVDRCGLRGLRIGGAHVSEKHANFIQADPGATAAEVHAVIERVRAVVVERTGFLLRSEVRLVGFAEEASGPER